MSGMLRRQVYKITELISIKILSECPTSYDVVRDHEISFYFSGELNRIFFSAAVSASVSQASSDRLLVLGSC